MYFERLLYNEMKEIYIDLIKNYQNENLKDSDKQFYDFIIDNYESNLIYNSYLITGIQKSKIVGFRIGNKYQKIDFYCFQNGEINECSDNIRDRLNDIFKVNNNRAKYIGYMARVKNKGNNNPFDKTIKTDNVMKFSDNKSRPGYVCNTTNRDKRVLKNYYKNIGGQDEIEKREKLSNKETICFYLEKQLRINDKEKKDGKRWFYTLEEAIQLNIHKR